MQISTLKKAVAEAQRFIERAEELETALEEAWPNRPAHLRDFVDGVPRTSGAVRRASLDLTRALADLRRRG